MILQVTTHTHTGAGDRLNVTAISGARGGRFVQARPNFCAHDCTSGLAWAGIPRAHLQAAQATPGHLAAAAGTAAQLDLPDATGGGGRVGWTGLRCVARSPPAAG